MTDAAFYEPDLDEDLPLLEWPPAPKTATTLEFVVTTDELPGFARAAPRQTATLVWYDDADGTLSAAGCSLRHDGTQWQLARIGPDAARDASWDWPACRPPEPLAIAADPADLPTIPIERIPVSAFDGIRRRARVGDLDIELLHGTVHGVVAGHPAGRVILTGPATAVLDWLDARPPLALSVPRASLAQEALSAATGTPLPARHLGAPALHDDPSVSDGLATVLSHLLDALLSWTDTIGTDGRPEAIHQARVATRRLRSALSIYAGVAPALSPLAEPVRMCAARLGAVRDWDVFLAGTGARLTEASGNDPRIAPLLRASARKRNAAAAELSAYLASPEFRRLEIDLGVATALRTWEHTADPAVAAPTTPFAAEILTRRLRRARRRARGIRTLPVEALHELRKDCKRLRYAADFFAPAFPGRPTKVFFRRLTDLQEQLGSLNDAAASVALMAQLGRIGRGYAGGMADGLAAASAVPARARIIKSWNRFKRADPFWK